MESYPADLFGRSVYSLAIEDPDSLPPQLDLPTPHFVCLLAWDARGVPNETIAALDDRLVDQGLAYLCAWPDCSGVELAVDLAVVQRQIEKSVKYLIPTTAPLEHDSLDEALWFMLWCAVPDEKFAPIDSACLAISIGNAEWDWLIRKRLADQRQLNIDVVGPGDD